MFADVTARAKPFHSKPVSLVVAVCMVCLDVFGSPTLSAGQLNEDAGLSGIIHGGVGAPSLRCSVCIEACLHGRVRAIPVTEARCIPGTIALLSAGAAEFVMPTLAATVKVRERQIVPAMVTALEAGCSERLHPRGYLSGATVGTARHACTVTSVRLAAIPVKLVQGLQEATL